ncbi:MAG TPA: phosphopantetheine-binding protein [Blastocatellia bacterium]|nr:phosphopantetheine-binding protein [Blastocatellia bacterium]
MPSGKVDRRALSEMPLPVLEREAADSGTQTEAERIIAAIWQEVLQVDRVGRYDNFFDLGGHSLLAARVAELIQEAPGQEFSIIDLFRYPAVSALAGHLTQSPGQQQGLSSALSRAGKQKQALERQRRARSQRGRPNPPKSQA